MTPGQYILQGGIDDFGHLIRACDLPKDQYRQRYDYFHHGE